MNECLQCEWIGTEDIKPPFMPKKRLFDVFSVNITIKLILRRARFGSSVRATINDLLPIELPRPEGSVIVSQCDFTTFINLEHLAMDSDGL